MRGVSGDWGEVRRLWIGGKCRLSRIQRRHRPAGKECFYRASKHEGRRIHYVMVSALPFKVGPNQSMRSLRRAPFALGGVGFVGARVNLSGPSAGVYRPPTENAGASLLCHGIVKTRGKWVPWNCSVHRNACTSSNRRAAVASIFLCNAAGSWARKMSKLKRCN